MTSYFQSKKIHPNPPSPEVRAAQLAQAQLQLTDGFFQNKRMEFTNKMASAGWDINMINNFLDGPGLSELNMETFAR